MTEFETKVLQVLTRIAAALEGPASSPGPAAAPGAPKPTPKPAHDADVAEDRDLDGQWGDPEIRKDPPRWEGESYAGKHYSQCSVEYLDELAGFLTWRANKVDAEGGTTSSGKELAPLIFRDASRARGWARRLRASAPREQVQPPPSPPDDFPDDPSIPF